jgi:hypothetical protein
MRLLPLDWFAGTTGWCGDLCVCQELTDFYLVMLPYTWLHIHK